MTTSYEYESEKLLNGKKSPNVCTRIETAFEFLNFIFCSFTRTMHVLQNRAPKVHAGALCMHNTCTGVIQKQKKNNNNKKTSPRE